MIKIIAIGKTKNGDEITAPGYVQTYGDSELVRDMFTAKLYNGEMLTGDFIHTCGQAHFDYRGPEVNYDGQMIRFYRIMIGE